MIKKIINKIWKAEGQEEINTPADQSAEFVLMYKELPIGVLSLKKGIWKFTYSELFRQQNTISPLVDFPDTSKIYENTQLWPFFSYRIPGLNQPMVQEIIRHEVIDEKNEVELLKKFGKLSVFNPFRLQFSH